MDYLRRINDIIIILNQFEKKNVYGGGSKILLQYNNVKIYYIKISQLVFNN